MLNVALTEARTGLAEGGLPIGAAIFDSQGQLVGAGHNRRVQHGDPSMHGETDAFRKAAVSVAIAALLWSRLWRLVGTAAGWSANLALAL
jgi:tRNA(Arg) A34 adenosine deaminase TadA